MSEITGNLDPKVELLVKYFNNNGLPTYMSCQGHNHTNMSMFWISFDDSVDVKEIIDFQYKHLDKYGNFCSCGRFSKRFYITNKGFRSRWEYTAATISAANADYWKWTFSDLYRSAKEKIDKFNYLEDNSNNEK